MNIEENILDYFRTIDDSLDNLSKHQEGKLSQLPSWAHTTRKIIVGITGNSSGIVFRAEPDTSLGQDAILIQENISQKETNRILSPISLSQELIKSLEKEGKYFIYSDPTMTHSQNPMSVPAIDGRFLAGYVGQKGFSDLFNEEKAKKEALELWNSCNLPNKDKNNTYIIEIRNILIRFQAIIKRKAFLERRIHRFINTHRNIFLPNFKHCFYEQPLILNNKKRKADFILEREHGLPPILLELESPTHKIFKKNMEPTQAVNHANYQIHEWIQFINENPKNNAEGNLQFLSNVEKEKLIIIGRGLEHKERLRDVKINGTMVWTYDLLLHEAKDRLNDQYADQCKILNMPEIRPF